MDLMYNQKFDNVCPNNLVDRHKYKNWLRVYKLRYFDTDRMYRVLFHTHLRYSQLDTDNHALLVSQYTRRFYTDLECNQIHHN